MMVRNHGQSGKLNDDVLCKLFCLTKEGLYSILRGNDWRPEYDVRSDGELASTKEDK